jgi:hypothetical protein
MPLDPLVSNQALLEKGFQVGGWCFLPSQIGIYMYMYHNIIEGESWVQR